MNGPLVHHVNGRIPRALPSRIRKSLQLLLQAWTYAEELRVDPWEFAVEIASLRRSRLTDCDLRWLICTGLVEHRHELTRPANTLRVFRPAANLALAKRSCFVATPAGLALARHGQLEGANKRPAIKIVQPLSCNGGRPEIPHWDDRDHTLYWKGEVVKHYRQEAPNQEEILRAFQACGWEKSTNVTLEHDPEMSAKERLRDAIKNLNRSVAPYLRFRQETNGSRVAWEGLS